ncbi:hypothetical protein AB4Y45_40680 [Paraburkholderia sp. EG287A]|uniref:hypothetical protein n=1 Tax=unclassified Paraburkholderia TaxID=2615204 RepID=UPI0034D24800
MLRFARELADTGRYADWRAIEEPLRSRYGDEQSLRLLNDSSLRDELDRRCQNAALASGVRRTSR